jgi:uncharacterized protein YbjQ (UPF0145 family)
VTDIVVQEQGMGESSTQAGAGEVQSPRGAEQRREKRYRVDGDAEIIVLGRPSMFWGRLTNLSADGCYVRTVAWVRLPPTTEVDILFTVNGRGVRARAEARYAQSRTGVGLRFLALGEEMQRRLDDLLASLRTAAAQKGGEAVVPQSTTVGSIEAGVAEATVAAAVEEPAQISHAGLSER